MKCVPVYLSVLLLLLFTLPAQGQLPVAESGPMTLTHTANLVQQTVNTLEAIFQSTQWILELTGFEDTGSSLNLLELEALITQTQTVLWDLQSLNRTITSLFALDCAPASSY